MGACLNMNILVAQETPTPAVRKASEPGAHLILSGGYGLTGSITSEALDGYSKTKFKGDTSLHASLRFSSAEEGGLYVDLSFYRFKFGLEEEGVRFGDLNLTYVIVTPGGGFVSRKPGGVGFFIGFLGLGILMTDFTEGPFIRDLEQLYGGQVTVETKKTVLAATLFPIKFDYVITKNIAIGASATLLLSNTGTIWRVDHEPLEDFKKFYTSNWQIHGVVSLLF
jgi:hypothetical protein